MRQDRKAESQRRQQAEKALAVSAQTKGSSRAPPLAVGVPLESSACSCGVTLKAVPFISLAVGVTLKAVPFHHLSEGRSRSSPAAQELGECASAAPCLSALTTR